MALPAIRDAKLPGAYVKAKDALEKCEKLDECKDWADKAVALASYARQAEDDSLRKLSTRIQARAIRRCGEILKKIEAAKNQHDAKARAGRGAPTSRRAAAKAAGLSKDQQVQAARVASIPKGKFEREVESDDPPTVTKLAEMGKLPGWVERVHKTGGRPEGFQQVTQAIGIVREMAEFCGRTDAKLVAEALSSDEVKKMRGQLRSIEKWVERLKRSF
jgi:hypothetical protein